jgi:hypothetical protein
MIEPDFNVEDGSFLLHLRKEDVGLGPRAVTLAGKTFMPKREVHITITGSALGVAIMAAMRGQPELEDKIRQMISETPWTYNLQNAWYHVVREEEESEKGYAESIIRLVEVPLLPSFYRRLEALACLAIPSRPTHVTLYTYGDEHGIGIATWDAFARLVTEQLDPAILRTESIS